MKDEEIKDILRKYKTVAVVGISPKEDRPSYGVASYLKSKGYRVIPVRPDGDEILGEKVYHSLMEIPGGIEIDVVDIFRKSEDVPPVVEEAIRRQAKVCLDAGRDYQSGSFRNGREGWLKGGHGPLHEERTSTTPLKCGLRNAEFGIKC